MKTLCVALSLTVFSVLALAQAITKFDPPGSIQWAQYGFLSTHTSFNSRETTLTRANVASLTFQWAGEVGLGIASAPIVGHGIVYVAADGMIFAFRASDGTPLWSHLSCSGVDTVQAALGPHALPGSAMGAATWPHTIQLQATRSGVTMRADQSPPRRRWMRRQSISPMVATWWRWTS